MFKTNRFTIMGSIVCLFLGYLLGRGTSFGAHVLMMVFAVFIGAAIGYVVDSIMAAISNAVNVENPEYPADHDRRFASSGGPEFKSGERSFSVRRLPSWISRHSRPF